jgi:(1->4)-alpha-D-glucan 1-alpha-D-glucosylmutase
MLVGSWPLEMTDLDTYKKRIKDAMIKSMREAKVHTTWAFPNSAYEDAVLAFVDTAMDGDIFHPFIERVARLGMHNSLVQTALKLTVPGVPDIYQGSELWDFSLVDPDNRRPVDYARRMQLLDHLEPNPQWRDGSIKLFLTTRLLKLRAAQPELFEKGDYEPLLATGSKADCICAFARRYQDRSVVVAASRFPARLEADPCWNGTRIPMPGGLRNIFTGAECNVEGGSVSANSVFRELPVAVFADCGS